MTLPVEYVPWVFAVVITGMFLYGFIRDKDE